VAAKGAVPIETFLPPETVSKMEARHFKPALMPPGIKTGDTYTVLLKPVLRFAISGIVWYQGEGNYQTAATCKYLFPWFVDDWRRAIAQAQNRTEIPFYFVQIPNHGTREIKVSGSFWADLRESQTAALKLKNVFRVTTIDTIVTEPASLHSKEKREIASRLLNLVRATKYGATIKAQSPTFSNFQRNGKYLTVVLNPANAKFIVKNGSTVQGFPVQGFQLAGKDKIFHRASGAIVGNKIQLFSLAVSEPVAVRYAWEDNPICSVYCIDLPLSPFRTDDWTTHPELNASDWPVQLKTPELTQQKNH
jgi:sialate O-acetylesterase